MAYIQSSHSQGTEGSFVAHKPAENISPEAYYQDPARQQRQRRWYIAKLVLHCIVWSIALALVVIDLCVISWLGFDFVTYSICSIWPAIASLCWITAELGTLAWRRTLSRGIDPRWNLSLHLLLWCGFACAAAFGGIFGRYEYYYYHYYYLSVPSAAYDLVDNRVVVISSLVISLVLLHFVLFVRCCVEVNRVNHEKQVTRVFRALARLNINDNSPTIAAPVPAVHSIDVELKPAQHAHLPPQNKSAPHSMELQQIPRRPVGAPLSTPPPGTAKDSYRVIDPDVEANLKFMGPLPVESVNGNHKYPSRVLRKA